MYVELAYPVAGHGSIGDVVRVTDRDGQRLIRDGLARLAAAPPPPPPPTRTIHRQKKEPVATTTEAPAPPVDTEESEE